ncbi:acyl-[acyl-carrier-protein] thioesterase [Candidatus Acetatifactor stercoripullorum]|uniref:acyl-[acyl-carrier-protein] thioesterase n=1 Tax=Candidatus Acetatifactor stercoripullorum TaxID=2838414 RepID=UPI00298E2A81|nr:acyl-ACP thioesterase domain-containing protein [Candidatus Acetatifactor stercoripullorum]
MYTFDSRVRYSETDSEGKLTLSSLLNYFQDCSTFQSEELGMGISYLRERHLVWVLSSWQIVVDRYPGLCEKVQTGTFPYAFKGFLGYRNFTMTDSEGAYLARANSLWTLLCTDTEKPAMPPKEMIEAYALEEKLDMDYAPRKIQIPGESVHKEPIVVKKHNLDTNHHVNNGQYVDIAMEYLPEDFTVGQLRAEYKKQAFLDDIFYPYVAGEENKIVVVLADADDRPYVCVEFQRKESVGHRC